MLREVQAYLLFLLRDSQTDHLVYDPQKAKGPGE